MEWMMIWKVLGVEQSRLFDGMRRGSGDAVGTGVRHSRIVAGGAGGFGQRLFSCAPLVRLAATRWALQPNRYQAPIA